MVLRVDYQEGVRISEDAQAIAIRVMVDGYHWREIKVSEKNPADDSRLHL